MGTTNVIGGLNYRLVRLIRTSKIEKFMHELEMLCENDRPYPRIVVLLKDESNELIDVEINRIQRMCDEVHITEDKSTSIGLTINAIDQLTEAIRTVETAEIMKDLLE